MKLKAIVKTKTQTSDQKIRTRTLEQPHLSILRQLLLTPLRLHNSLFLRFLGFYHRSQRDAAAFSATYVCLRCSRESSRFSGEQSLDSYIDTVFGELGGYIWPALMNSAIFPLTVLLYPFNIWDLIMY